ncbi:hypothetical protein BLNAU_4555 [Blattamonas nauphoetae]|uniref:Secreted protein n=1 Tax=Blattamonas nauphoetae TaxID=2049346 RepID=A0ABQ9Y9G8_9EUKA|nr:hypothetical protein BLNAU_4555 [Blattamonas nauphoetae]
MRHLFLIQFLNVLMPNHLSSELFYAVVALSLSAPSQPGLSPAELHISSLSRLCDDVIVRIHYRKVGFTIHEDPFFGLSQNHE